MIKRLITKLLTLLILAAALLSNRPSANSAPAQLVDCGGCTLLYQQCVKSGGNESVCFTQRQECRAAHGCAYCTTIFFCP